MLKSIEIKGFKSIKDQKVDLRPLNVLIGANGSGKSNFIQVFDFLRNIVEKKLQLYTSIKGGANRLLHFGSEETDEIYIETIFVDDSYKCILRMDDNDRFIFTNEECSDIPLISEVSEIEDAIIDEYDDEHTTWYNEDRPHTETYLNENLKRNKRIGGLDAIISTSKSWRIYHFNNTGSRAKVKLSNNINDTWFYREDAANLAPYLYLLREKYPDYYRKIVSVIQLVAPFFDDFVLHPTPLNQDMIMLEWKEKYFDMYCNANTCSDGTLRFISLATLLMQPDELLPELIIIDEPEIGLHPYAISILAGMIRKAAVKTQVVVTTQSVTLIDQFAPEDIIVVNREDKETTFHRYTTEELEVWLEDYSLGEIWEKNIIGGRP